MEKCYSFITLAQVNLHSKINLTLCNRVYYNKWNNKNPCVIQHSVSFPKVKNKLFFSFFPNQPWPIPIYERKHLRRIHNKLSLRLI